MSIFKNLKIIQYIFFEMLPSFILGLLVFLAIILMFQVLRLTEFALVHGVGVLVIAKIIGFICISLLPALLPMSLLFSILWTYGRLSQDSEIIAMKSAGLSMPIILSPALMLSALIAVLSAQTTFHIAPWGNRQFEVLFTQMSQTKAGAAIREGTFSEGFFDMVIYASEVDSKSGLLKKLFIYDDSKSDLPLTIIAKKGQIIRDPDSTKNEILLRMQDGNIHRQGVSHTKIKFDTYDIQLSEPTQQTVREKSPQSLTIEEVLARLQEKKINAEEMLSMKTEFHKRWSIAALCLIFALLGVGFGINTNRRSAKSSGLILCLGLIIGYWILYITCEGMARSGKAPVFLAIWLPNTLYFCIASWKLKVNWN
ncbi:MAG: LPS export ABC transporter permease LptF [Pseudobdellovibrionaceae bacterium]